MNVLQIAGGEGSGKTRLALTLAEQWTGVMAVMTLERYLRNKRAADGPDFIFQPTSIDWPLLRLHIDALARGERIMLPEYDLARGQRLPPKPALTGQVRLNSTNVVVCEGLHYLTGDVESIKVFVDTPTALRLERVRQRDQALDQHMADIFETVIEPAYQRYTQPLRDQANLVLDGRQDTPLLATEVQRFAASIWGGWG